MATTSEAAPVDTAEGRRLPNVMPAWWILEEGGQRSVRRIVSIWQGFCWDETEVRFKEHDSRRWLGPFREKPPADALLSSSERVAELEAAIREAIEAVERFANDPPVTINEGSIVGESEAEIETTVLNIAVSNLRAALSGGGEKTDV